MPLYPPPQLIDHPADLVIDVFGTFLGKRSERMVVRWRETPANLASDSTAPADMLPAVTSQAGGDLADAAGAQSVPEARGPATDDPPVVAVIDGRNVTLMRSTSACDDAAGRRPAGDVFQPVVHSPQNGPPYGGRSPSRSQDAPPPKRAADIAAARLIELWARAAPGGQTMPSSPAARLGEQLDGIADRPAAGRSGGQWNERAVPMSRLRSVTVSGRGVTISSDLIAALVERGIGLSFLSGRGSPVAQLSAPGLGGTVQTRRSQLAAYSSPLGVRLAVEFIRGKLRNQKHQLKYSGKYLKSSEPARFERLVKKIAAIGNLRKQLVDFQADDLDSVRDKLMGYEGTGARLYWDGVAILFEGRVKFPGRQTRGALDPVNGSLNYGYGILYAQVSAAVVNAGLEMYAGFLHVDRPGKPALVLDLVEEFRAPVVDRAVLAIVNQGMPLETDAYGLTAATRKLVADRVLERLSTAVPYEGKRWTLGTIIQNQARHLAVAVRGEREYRAFASRW